MQPVKGMIVSAWEEEHATPSSKLMTLPKLRIAALSPCTRSTFMMEMAIELNQQTPSSAFSHDLDSHRQRLPLRNNDADQAHDPPAGTTQAENQPH